MGDDHEATAGRVLKAVAASLKVEVSLDADRGTFTARASVPAYLFRGETSPRESERALCLARRVRLESLVFGKVELRWSLSDEFSPRGFGSALRCEVFAKVRERGRPDGPEESTVFNVSEVSVASLAIMSDRDAVHRLAITARLALDYFVRHEVDEMILVDGERTFDPHRGDEPSAVRP